MNVAKPSSLKNDNLNVDDCLILGEDIKERSFTKRLTYVVLKLFSKNVNDNTQTNRQSSVKKINYKRKLGGEY